MAANEPAYPCTTRKNTSTDPLATPRDIHWPGMTLRDYFAGQALAGILATGAGEGDDQHLRRVIAYDAYAYADAMLTERNRNAD